MRKKLYTFILFLLIVTTDIALGKDGNKHKPNKTNHTKQNHKEKEHGKRIKRSLHEDQEPFWPNRGKKLTETIEYVPEHHLTDRTSDLNSEQPFWGTRGRRESSSSENYNDLVYTEESENYNQNLNKCNDCLNINDKVSHKYMKDRREESSPFWGNRGRRDDKMVSDEYNFEPFWASRGRRQENDPFWGNRGKKEDEPFWGNRGKKEDEPFWGNRGRRDNAPFWGNRGRREELEPFWGNRGRREEEPFWGNRGRRRLEPFQVVKGRRKEQLKEYISSAINNVEKDIDRLSRLKRNFNTNFWMNKGRDSKIKHLFNRPRYRLDEDYVSNLKTLEAGTVSDNRIFAEEPHYIIVDRSSRSSAEDDPFFISRGKKYYLTYNLNNSARDRRGAIEEIVKSMRNDPYYIARGKKDDLKENNENFKETEKYLKAKEFICSAIDLIKYDNTKVKREIDETERDRRTILKKLAAQLQMDPYYASRGKKNDTYSNKDVLAEFIKDVADKCNLITFDFIKV